MSWRTIPREPSAVATALVALRQREQIENDRRDERKRKLRAKRRAARALAAKQASDRLIDAGIDSYVCAWEKPSDHVPVWIDPDLETA